MKEWGNSPTCENDRLRPEWWNRNVLSDIYTIALITNVVKKNAWRPAVAEYMIEMQTVIISAKRLTAEQKIAMDEQDRAWQTAAKNKAPVKG